MDWLNIHRSTLAAEEFLGCDPIQRATWLCLLAYCADQENGGRIDGAEAWGDRKWQQVVRITRDEVHDNCPLWEWSDGCVIVWAYPVEKEEEVRRNRANGGKGGRPPKPENNQVVTSGLSSGLTQTITQTEPSGGHSAETEGKGIGKEEEGKRKGKNKGASVPRFVPPTEAEWVAYCTETWPEWHPTSAGNSYAHYQGTGWRTKAGPVKDWKATARTAHGKAVEWGTLQPKIAPTAPPTFEQWIDEANKLVRERVKPSPEWPYAGAEAEFQKNQASGWRFIQDWRAACAAAHSRFLAIEDATQNRRNR